MHLSTITRSAGPASVWSLAVFAGHRGSRCTLAVYAADLKVTEGQSHSRGRGKCKGCWGFLGCTCSRTRLGTRRTPALLPGPGTAGPPGNAASYPGPPKSHGGVSVSSFLREPPCPPLLLRLTRITRRFPRAASTTPDGPAAPWLHSRPSQPPTPIQGQHPRTHAAQPATSAAKAREGKGGGKGDNRA